MPIANNRISETGTSANVASGNARTSGAAPSPASGAMPITSNLPETLFQSIRPSAEELNHINKLPDSTVVRRGGVVPSTEEPSDKAHILVTEPNPSARTPDKSISARIGIDSDGPSGDSLSHTVAPSVNESIPVQALTQRAYVSTSQPSNTDISKDVLGNVRGNAKTSKAAPSPVAGVSSDVTNQNPGTPTQMFHRST